MKHDDLTVLKQIFAQSLGLEPAARAGFLEQALADDPTALAEAKALLHFDGHPNRLFEAQDRAALLPTPLVSSSDVGNSTTLSEKIGPYVIVRCLGQGGMASVYLAEQAVPRRPVAIKLMKNSFPSHSDHERFRYEADLLAQLNHKGIAQIYEFRTHVDNARQFPYFVMEYVPDAQTIVDYCNAGGLPIVSRLRLFLKLCDAVQHGHQKGVIHRDLKPANILVNACGEPKVIDFGIARVGEPGTGDKTAHRSSGTFAGTFAYMSPEQIDGKYVDVRTDIYSLGAVLYEMLCGCLPLTIEGLSLLAARLVVLERIPLTPSAVSHFVGKDLDAIALKALAKEPERRYQSVSEMVDDIGRHLRNEPVRARHPTLPYKVSRFARRHKWSAAALVAVLSLSVAAIWQAVRATRAETEALRVSEVDRHLRGEAEGDRAHAVDAKKRARAAADDARTASLRAQRVTQFLTDMLTSADPARAKGRKVCSLRDILDEASTRVATEFDAEPDVEANIREAIGATFLSLGVYDAAEQHFRAVLQIRKEVVGAETPELARILQCMAELLGKIGRYGEAAEQCREALAVSRRVSGEDSLPTTQYLGALTKFESQAGELNRADATLLQWLGKLGGGLRTPDEMGHDLLHTLDQIREAWRRGKRERALELIRVTVEPFAKVPFVTAPMIATALADYGLRMLGRGDLDTAEPLLQVSAEMHRELLGESDPHAIDASIRLAWCLQARGDHGQAEQLARTSLDLCRKNFPDGHPYTVSALTIVGASIVDQGRADEAEPLLRNCVDTAHAILPKGHWQSAYAEVLLGHCLAALGRFDEAEALMVLQYASIERSLGKTDRVAIDALRRVVQLYETSSRSDQAMAYRSKLDVALVLSASISPFAPTPDSRYSLTAESAILFATSSDMCVIGTSVTSPQTESMVDLFQSSKVVADL